MTRWKKIAGALAGAGSAGLAAAVAIGARAWKRETERALERLRAAGAAPDRQKEAPEAVARAGEPERYDPAQLDGLPKPVVRYFEFALTPGQPLVRSARLTQEGSFALSRDRWSRFTATEHFETSPPGFLWDARIRMAPLVTAYVRDSYVAGEGAVHARIASLVKIADQHGTREMASGSLLRYLAEAVWIPTALLPACGVRWEPVGDSTARASLTDSGTTVAMDVRFGPDGEIKGIFAARHRDVKGTPVLTPWSGRFSSYARIHGMMVPVESEVGWDLPDRRFPYWRGRTVRTEVEFRGAGAASGAETAAHRADPS